MNLDDLDRDSRLRLVRFVCSFAWADLEVQEAERNLVLKLLKELGLDEDERGQAERWLKVPPHPEDVNPMDIPLEHRQIFLNSVLQVVGADGVVDIRASVLREVEEETGLVGDQLTVCDGFLLTTIGQQVSIAVDLVCREDAQALQSRVRRTLSGLADSELDDVILVGNLEDLALTKVPAYADVLLRRILRPSP